MKQVYRYVCVLCLAVFVSLLGIRVADAFGGDVTSPFGYRFHPLTGEWKGHTGVDLGLDEGTPLPAIVDGTITYAGWMDGYGYTVMMQEDNGDEYLYGHLSDFSVRVGDVVVKDEIIALSGNTGYSTGPHLHFEHRINGQPVNPISKMLAEGWSINNGYEPAEGFPNGMGLLKAALGLDKKVELDFEYFYHMGKEIRTVSDHMVEASMKAVDGLLNVGIPLLALLATIDFLMLIWKGPILGGQLDGPFWSSVTSKALKYGFLAGLIMGWKTMINVVFLGTINFIFQRLGKGDVMKDITAPDTLLQHFVSFLNPSMSWLGNLTVKDIIDQLGLFFLNFIVTYASLGLLVLLVISVVIIFIELYLAIAFSSFAISFAGLEFTKFIGEGMVGYLINSTIKLLCVAVVLAFMTTVMNDYSYDATDPLGVLGVFFYIGTIVAMGILLPKRLANGLFVEAKL